MKKCLLTMLLAIVGCVTVMAGDDIKLSEGKHKLEPGGKKKIKTKQNNVLL